MGSYQRLKFLKRFLAAIAALFFWSTQLVFPAAVQAQMNVQVPLPSAATSAVLQSVAPIALTNVAKEVVKTVPFKPVPLIVGGLVAGAAYYVISEVMKEQFKEKAIENYCSANPSSPLCGGGSGEWKVTYSGLDTNTCGSNGFDEILYYAFQVFKASKPWTDGTKTCAAYKIVDAAGTEVNPYPQYFYASEIIIEKLTSDNVEPWENWSPSEQDSALDTLTPDDIEQIIDIPPLFLTPNKTFSDGGWFVGPSGNFEFSPPFSVRSDSPEPEFSLDLSFPPNSFQNDDLDNDGDRNEIDFDIDNDGDWNLTDRNDFDFEVNTENNYKLPPQPSPSPSPTPTSGAACKCCPDPVTGELPKLLPECDGGNLTDKNFLSYAVSKTVDKFPFDILGDMPSIDKPYPCPVWTFWGQSHEFCIINDILASVKWIVWMVFLIKSIISI